ncbi:MAG TPA: tetratricopeptide repeat protein [Candidatus Omnitrophota bacterium]|nr:tetratricopeptide repeat protein [Candidatus Omnitrophota bacterium]HPS37299.1 tetratricopeptide repeat protein [Candidatus Omnitrophota bacterium]
MAEISSEDYQRALKLLEQEQYDAAIEVLQKSLQEDPNQAPLYNLLGLVYLQQNESVTSAIGSFEQAIRIDPNYAEAYFNLASAYAGAANRPELAAEFFQKTLAIDPKFVKAYFGMGWFTLISKEDSVAAKQYFEKAIEYFPDFAEAYYGLGLCYIQMGKAPMALASVSQLRSMGREELASYLEMVIRGGKISEEMAADVNAPANPQDAPAPESGVPIQRVSASQPQAEPFDRSAAQSSGGTPAKENGTTGDFSLAKDLLK